VKPVVGGGGHGVNILLVDGDEFTVNGKRFSKSRLATWLSRRSAELVESLLVPHEYSRTLFPATVNTIRMLAMRDPDTQEPFIAVAVHRMGTGQSSRTDNWTQGGLSCHVDLAQGELGPGVAHPGYGELQWHDKHPDTGAILTGLRVPYWSEARSLVLRLMRHFNFLQYVGWDIVITPDGPRVIEGNHYSDVNLLQVHRPLLADERVARFYRAHRVIK
jgi:hypothetical protein